MGKPALAASTLCTSASSPVAPIFQTVRRLQSNHLVVCCSTRARYSNLGLIRGGAPPVVQPYLAIPPIEVQSVVQYQQKRTPLPAMLVLIAFCSRCDCWDSVRIRDAVPAVGSPTPGGGQIAAAFRCTRGGVSSGICQCRRAQTQTQRSREDEWCRRGSEQRARAGEVKYPAKYSPKRVRAALVPEFDLTSANPPAAVAACVVGVRGFSCRRGCASLIRVYEQLHAWPCLPVPSLRFAVRRERRSLRSSG